MQIANVAWNANCGVECKMLMQNVAWNVHTFSPTYMENTVVNR